MALTRSFLKDIGLTDEQITSVIEAHTQTTDALKAERDKFKSDLNLQGERLTALENVQQRFDEYKTGIEAEKMTAAKTAALRKMFTDAGVKRENFIDLLMKTIDMDSVKLDGDSIAGADEIIGTARESYAELFAKEKFEGIGSTKALGTGRFTMTLDEFSKMSLPDQLKFAATHPMQYKIMMAQEGGDDW